MSGLYSCLRLKQVAYLAGVLIPSILTTASAAPPADEVFSVTGAIFEPGTASFKSGDISFDDPAIKSYFNADKTNAAVDRIHTDANPLVIDWLAAGSFKGATADHNVGGPNGVTTANNSTEVWAGDGDSTAKVVQLSNTSAIYKTIKTGTFANPDGKTGKFTQGTQRADEMCEDPADHLVLIANDAPADTFVDFISTTTYTVVKAVKFNGSDPNGKNINASAGIEQCKWSPRTGKIYLNIPEVNGPGDNSTPGAVLVFDPKTMNIEKVFTIPLASCAGPAGMAIGPNNQILLGCNAASPNGTLNSVIINENSGAIIATLANEGGTDEVWFNPGDGHYLLPQPGSCGTCVVGTFQHLGVVDAVNHQVDQSVKTVDGTNRAGSVAADPLTNKVFVPIRGDANLSTVCSSVTGKTADDVRGCIAVLTTTNDDRAKVGSR